MRNLLCHILLLILFIIKTYWGKKKVLRRGMWNIQQNILTQLKILLMALSHNCFKGISWWQNMTLASYLKLKIKVNMYISVVFLSYLSTIKLILYAQISPSPGLPRLAGESNRACESEMIDRPYSTSTKLSPGSVQTFTKSNT